MVTNTATNHFPINFLQDFQKLRTTYWPEIRRQMIDVVESNTPKDSSLIVMFKKQLDSGGKRLRAILPLLVAQAFGRPPEELIPFGAACEMLHNATLVHDDIQDQDMVRRGKPTIWAQYGVEHAIDLGDAMLYYAVLLLQKLDLPPRLREQAMCRFMRKTLKVIDGQEREFHLGTRRNPSVEDYTRMVEGKTSALFELPLVGALEICKVSSQITQCVKDSARQLGVLFQIQDDILDIYGDKGRGAIGNDIREGKRSLFVVSALEHSSSQQGDWLLGILDKERDDICEKEVQDVIALFESSGAYRFVLSELRRRHDLALQIVENAGSMIAYKLISDVCMLLLQPISFLFEEGGSRTEVAETRV